jgi:hypothetical protein
MPETTAKSASKRSHWATVSDERLIDLDLVIDNPESLPGLARQVPANFADAHVEYKYDLRGQEMLNEFTCVHGSHQHKAGFAMNVEGLRFMVGWQCAKSIYGEDFDQYTADFDAMKTRQDALRRVREIRDGLLPFVQWVETLSKSDICKQFSKIRGQLDHQMSWVYDNLPALAQLDVRVTKAELPIYICDPKTDIRAELERLMNETATAQIMLVGEPEKVAAIIGALRRG